MIDFEALGQAIFEAAIQGLEQGTAVVATRAKARAPVRNIFGVRFGFRAKSIDEIEAARAALGGEVGSMAVWKVADVPRTKVARRLRRRWRQRRLAAADALLTAYDAELDARRRGYPPTKTMLSRLGAYEVRTKRAQFTTFGHSMIGGRLRGEIYPTRAGVTGKTAEAWVISPTPYARYVEFGTRHNRAFPYLRPAAEESRAEVISRIAAAVQEASRTGATNTEIEIVVRI